MKNQYRQLWEKYHLVLPPLVFLISSTILFLGTLSVIHRINLP